VALGVAAVLGIVAVAAVVFVGRRVVDKASDAGFDLSLPGDCSFVDANKASDALGAPVQVTSLGVFDVVTEAAFDGRFLTEGKACLVVSDGQGDISGRVVVADVGDGEARYAEIRERAEVAPTDNRGEGLSVVSGADFHRDVDGVGDEAFCSSVSGGFFNGVLARKGDKLVYATFVVASADVDARSEPNGATTFLNEANCERGAALAKAVLG
jgi:hypothetical protein